LLQKEKKKIFKPDDEDNLSSDEITANLGKELRDGYAIALLVTANIASGSLSSTIVSDVTQPHATYICSITQCLLSCMERNDAMPGAGLPGGEFRPFSIEKSNGLSRSWPQSCPMSIASSFFFILGGRLTSVQLHCGAFLPLNGAYYHTVYRSHAQS